MNLSTFQKRLFAWGMAKANSADYRQIKISNHPDYSNLSDLKQALLGKLAGKILEIGPGAGANLGYYPKNIDWIGIEPNPFMLTYLEQEANKQGINLMELYQGYAENLPISDNSIDAVVSTHVLCSVENVELTLEEIYRVLKPNGRLIFLEHIADNCGTFRRTIQDRIEPIWGIIFDNCHPNREPEKLFEKVGFNTLNHQYFQLNFPVVSPHVVGIAEKI